MAGEFEDELSPAEPWPAIARSPWSTLRNAPSASSRSTTSSAGSPGQFPEEVLNLRPGDALKRPQDVDAG
jgi:hypothetical protein